MKIIMLAYPNLTPLDLLGPLQVWSFWPNAEIQIVWKNTAPIMTDVGMAIVPTHSFDDCFSNPDILFVPGGAKSTIDLMSDNATINFLQEKATNAQWVTSVCTGALLLGAAGLLTGYKATTHWATHDKLAGFSAIPTQGRYVIDRSRATGVGITSGIDFGLALLAEIEGEDVAKAIQLLLEYSPHPPFASGTPHEASEETVQKALGMFAKALA